MAVILGLDIALANCGYAIVDDDHLIDYGVIQTLKGEPIGNRLAQIRADIICLCQTYKPQDAVIEHPFFPKENYNAGKVLAALGVVLLALGECELNPFFLHQSQVKSSVTGDGRADKKGVQQAVQFLFRLSEPPRPDDAADAIAVAYAHQIGVRSEIKY